VCCPMTIVIYFFQVFYCRKKVHLSSSLSVCPLVFLPFLFNCQLWFPVFRSSCLSICMSTCLPIFPLSCVFCISVFLSFCLPVCLSACPPVFLSFLCLVSSVFPSFCLPVCLTFYLPIRPSIRPSGYPSVN